VTPPGEPFIHTFFDLSPWSPSGRYLLAINLPFENREPVVGDRAGICVIDLKERTIECVYETAGWAMQLGAHQQWGPTDRYLYFNDADGQEVFTVEYDLEKGSHRRLNGPLYMLSPDGSCSLGPSLTLINFVQKGYGVPVDAETFELPPSGPRPDEGLWKTDVGSGEGSLLLSFERMVEEIPQLRGGAQDMFFYFHTKFNPQGDRIMQVHSSYAFDEEKGRVGGNRCIITFRPDLSEMKLALRTEQWEPGGHHPNWHPDGTRITMNLKPDGTDMKFCEFNYDGSEFRVFSKELAGGGHPSLTADGRYLVTDAYVEEPIALKNDETPIRLCGVDSNFERHPCYIRTICEATKDLDGAVPAEAKRTVIDKVSHKQSALDIYRLDPHPAWNRDFTQVCFNGAPEGVRQLLVAEVGALLP
jgi:hypothetical protein